MKSKKEAELSGKILSGLKWTATIRILGQLINWGMSIIVIRYIKPEEYGLKAMAEISVALLMLLSSGGMESALVHVKEISGEKISKTFGLLISINLLLFILQIFAAYPIAEYYNEPRIVPIAHVMAFGFLLVPFTAIPTALLSRDMDYRLLSTISLMTNVIGAVSTLTMALYGYGVWSLVAGPLISSLLFAILINSYKPWLRLPIISVTGVHDMVMFGGTVALTSILWMVYSRSDIAIAGRMMDAHQVGIYAVALHLASLPVDKIIPVLNQVAFPAYARYRDQPESIVKYFLKAVRLTSFLLFPVSFGLAGVSQLLIPALLGKEWSAVPPILLVLSLVFSLRGIGFLCAPLTNAMGKPKIQLKLVILSILLMVPGFIVGAKFGGIGLAIAWFTVYPILWLSNLWSSARAIHLSFLKIIKTIALPLVMASIMLFDLLCFTSLNIIIVNTSMTIGVMVIAGATIYLMGIYVGSKKLIYELYSFVRK